MAIESIEEVRLFRQVVASGSISAAARALGDQKNRISQRIASLERSLGVRLADRTTRTLKLTDEGERFLAASEALIEAVERVESAVARGDALEGRVRVALRSANTGIGLGEEVARMMSTAPGLELQIVVLDDDADLLSLQAQGIDLAVQVGRLKDSSLVAKRVGNVPYAMCATPAYLRANGRPRKPSDLLQHECIRRLGDVRETSWALVDRHGRSRPTPIGGRLQRCSLSIGDPLCGVWHRVAASRRGSACSPRGHVGARFAFLLLRASSSLGRRPQESAATTARRACGGDRHPGDRSSRLS